jgi:hypothetical protein
VGLRKITNTSVRIVGILDKIRSGHFSKSNALLLQATYCVILPMEMVNRPVFTTAWHSHNTAENIFSRYEW